MKKNQTNNKTTWWQKLSPAQLALAQFGSVLTFNYHSSKVSDNDYCCVVLNK